MLHAIEALHDRTHGIPFYVEELALTLCLDALDPDVASEGGTSLAPAIAQRAGVGAQAPHFHQGGRRPPGMDVQSAGRARGLGLHPQVGQAQARGHRAGQLR